MFTGLIESTGTILSIMPSESGTRVTIAAPHLASRLRTGDSISVSGVCLTALDIDPASAPPRFSADLASETTARTTLSRLQPGSIVNLELPTPAGSPLGGHVVQGHVDGVATVLALEPIHPSHLHSTDWRLAILLPPDLARHVVQQGSITIEGISLTVARLQPNFDGSTEVEIAIIPHTWKATNLHSLTPGSPVNIETDVLARYAEQQTRRPKADWLTTAFLLANGY